MLLPTRPVPPLSVSLASGGEWSLTQETPENFTLVVIYRGLHCPICKGYLGKLQSKLSALAERGVSAIAISTDSAERAQEAKREWDLGSLRLGYGLTIETARAWGLYISSGRGTEPQEFAEPGLFLIRPGGTLYFASVQSMPFTRPNLDELIQGLDFVIKSGYPARGELAA
jgi:peroxiredoxin